MPDDQLRKELIKKFQWAGRIRLISSSLLFAFLLLMKFVGGYSYLNPALSSLIFIEAVLNQPYDYFLKRVNISRFPYYQMLIDSIAISWVLYYMGGIEAPIVSMAYYAVILWAGFIAGTSAVYFAVVVSCLFFSSIVLLEHFGVLPAVSFLDLDISTPQVFSLLVGNISFMFAFGYFSARSSAVIRDIQRKRQGESLRYAHRLSTAGYLVGKTAHDIQGCFAGIKGGVQVLLGLGTPGDEEKKLLNSIGYFENKGAGLVRRLAEFSQNPVKEHAPADIHAVIEKALGLTEPLVKYSRMTVEKKFERDLPLIAANKDQIKEVFVVMILNSLDSISAKPKGGVLTIETVFHKEKHVAEIVFSDTGAGIRRDDLRRIGEPFFSTKRPGEGSGLGLATAYDIISNHKGKIAVTSTAGEGAAFTISLPVA